MKSTGKIHATYVIGILIAVIVLLLTVEWGSIPELVDLVSFALTMASLVLAAVAIVYALISGSGMSEQLGRLEKTTSDVANVSGRLSILDEDLRSLVRAIPAKLDSVESQLRDTRSLVSEFATNARPNVRPGQGDLSVAEKISGNASASGLVLLVALKTAQEKGVALDLRTFTDATPFVDAQYGWGWIAALNATDLVDLKFESGPRWTVNRFDEGLLKFKDRLADAIRESAPTPELRGEFDRALELARTLPTSSRDSGGEEDDD